nr:hypothetical protein [Escherichia coli]
MLLPLFPLPSRPTELIQFRQPNIADAMRFNSIDRNLNPKKIKKTPKNGCLFDTACVP